MGNVNLVRKSGRQDRSVYEHSRSAKDRLQVAQCSGSEPRPAFEHRLYIMHAMGPL